jgi:hypothetical protein
MKIRVQLVVCDDDGHEENFTDVAVLKKGQPAHGASGLDAA